MTAKIEVPSVKLFETTGVAGVERPPVLVSFGGGLNSVALCLGLYVSQQLPDAILMADTGGEKPETYQYLFWFDEILAKLGFPTIPNQWQRPPGYEPFGLPEQHLLKVIQVVRNSGRYGTLEKNCLETRTVPSLAYGHRSCSDKYKIRPQHQWTKQWAPAQAWWQLSPGGVRPRDVTQKQRDGRLVTRLLGYDAGEGHRSSTQSDDFYRYLYPLRVWGWTREQCLAVLDQFDVPVPAKSACFFCPANRKPEIIELGQRWPGLLQRALTMEQVAADGGGTEHIKGLGRWYSWASVVAGQGEPAQVAPAFGCLCGGPGSEINEGEGVDNDDEST